MAGLVAINISKMLAKFRAKRAEFQFSSCNSPHSFNQIDLSGEGLISLKSFQ